MFSGRPDRSDSLGVIGARIDSKSLGRHLGSKLSRCRPGLSDGAFVFGFGAVGELVRVPSAGGQTGSFDLVVSVETNRVMVKSAYLDSIVNIRARQSISLRYNIAFSVLARIDLVFDTLGYVDSESIGRDNSGPEDDGSIERITWSSAPRLRRWQNQARCTHPRQHCACNSALRHRHTERWSTWRRQHRIQEGKMGTRQALRQVGQPAPAVSGSQHEPPH